MVIVLSLAGFAAIGGPLPSARSVADAAETSVKNSLSAADRYVINTAGESACASCGAGAAVRIVDRRANSGTEVDAAAGGVTNAVVGKQADRDKGSIAASIRSEDALVSNEIGKKLKKHPSYRVTVRMDDESSLTV